MIAGENSGAVRETRKYRVRHGHADVEVRRAALVDHGLARGDVELLHPSFFLDPAVHRPRREPGVVRALQRFCRETPERVRIADLRDAVLWTTASRARGDCGLPSRREETDVRRRRGRRLPLQGGLPWRGRRRRGLHRAIRAGPLAGSFVSRAHTAPRARRRTCAAARLPGSPGAWPRHRPARRVTVTRTRALVRATTGVSLEASTDKGSGRGAPARTSSSAS
mmetsp:Transcript_16425/g.46602  ORF Transcript_16425/g.46602 Transcript_16425/m.46602 type:complete len:223 (+) Transcript_16425:1612-2280(+)